MSADLGTFTVVSALIDEYGAAMEVFGLSFLDAETLQLRVRLALPYDTPVPVLLLTELFDVYTYDLHSTMHVNDIMPLAARFLRVCYATCPSTRCISRCY